MDYLEYYKKVKAQKQINKLAKKYRNKKIIVYGAGIMADTLFKNYDISKLNIIGVCDKKFETSENKTFFSYTGFPPSEIKNLDFYVILVLLLQDFEIIEFLKDKLLINTKNEFKKVETFIKIPFFKCLQILLG